MFASLLLQARSVFLRQHNFRIYETCVQPLLLQSVQQYTGKGSWQFSLVQQYTDNQLKVPMRSGLRIWTLMMIIFGGFKEFNSTLTKTKI